MQYKYAAAAEDESANARFLPPTNLKTNDAVKTGAINANANIDMPQGMPQIHCRTRYRTKPEYCEY